MKKTLLTLAVSISGLLAASNAGAVLVSTNGSLSSEGTAAAIIAAPANANDDEAFNTGIQAFNEVVGFTLGANLMVDGGIIAAGTRVDSHMIFLNSGPGNSTQLIEHGAGGNQNAATFTFDGDILGVMSDFTGSLEVNSSAFLGNPATSYPIVPFDARGLEGDPLDGLTNNDFYSFGGSTITLGMRVTEPGDWIRVVTVSQVPLPATLPLLGGALGLMGFLRWRRQRRLA